MFVTDNGLNTGADENKTFTTEIKVIINRTLVWS